MDIIVLIIMGFLLLAFILIFRKRHTHGVEQMMKVNKDVTPLFKLKSARFKYETLHCLLQNKPADLQKLEQLHTDFDNGQLDLQHYYTALDELMTEHNNH